MQFDHYFRNYPNYGIHQAGYCISAGLEWLVDWIQGAHFRPEDIAYLRGQVNGQGQRVFDDDFLRWLEAECDFSQITLRAIPEGRVVHPGVPLTAVQGPLAMAQLLETALLNRINYQTLIATKAARIYESGRGRRYWNSACAEGMTSGANAGTRAALIGGADFSSNVGISHVLGVPPKGTHAHSMVQIFMSLGEGELGAFRAYASVYPDDCLLLVDTMRHAGQRHPERHQRLRGTTRRGHQPAGIRHGFRRPRVPEHSGGEDAGRAGFPETTIVLSNDLDELVIWQIITQIQEEAPR